nr:immunoglobulin heavy chain junction region [Mus musculus]
CARGPKGYGMDFW